MFKIIQYILSLYDRLRLNYRMIANQKNQILDNYDVIMIRENP
jgi:hypothetical protein